MGRIAGGLWVLLVVVGTADVITSFAATAEDAQKMPLTAVAVVVVWVITILALAQTPIRVVLQRTQRRLRQRPILYWFVVLVTTVILVSAWIVPYQPTFGRAVLPLETTIICLLAWLLWFLYAYGWDREQARAVGAALGRSKLTGVMLTLTTLVALFFAGEAYLRIFYITTDAYGFTAMNYHWYNNFYWGHYNSLGFRDYEPKPDAPGLTRVAVLGDSFAVGHGMTDIDDSFPQLLEQRLGDGYDVNVVAQSGWDSDVQTFEIDRFPLRPQIVVLSYYLNDIDYLLSDPEINPDSSFDFPQNDVLHWFVLNFFLPNYVYYNLLQFTSQARTANFIDALVQPYLDDSVWYPHTERLNSLVDWTRQRDIRLIVLLWPSIVAIDHSQPAIERLTGFYRERGVQVVDMSDRLRGYPPLSLIVNRFDTHPGAEAHRLAADALYEAITAPSS